MDGNGRWANQRGLPRIEGHKAGEPALLDVMAGAIEMGIEYVSVYAFSTENWRRSPEEVRFLMGFNKDVLRRQRNQLDEWGVRIRWSGRRPRLWGSVIRELEEAEEIHRREQHLHLDHVRQLRRPGGNRGRSVRHCRARWPTAGSSPAPSPRRPSKSTSTSRTFPTSTCSCAVR